ncbi:MAG: class I tRNA ligase family protein [Patescibacteria group bacterium]|nr:class I tRNA ligase family protein [Patescibacteria group bacterium]
MVKKSKTTPDSHTNFPKLEEEILDFWNKNNIFEKSLKQRADCKKFVFYEGPPFATGLPHYGHLITSIAKDIVPRYQTMKGNFVERCWGWDCHGLPIETIAEKNLNIKNKKDIEDIVGIDRFNTECQRQILEYAGEWERIVTRFGRWVDWKKTYLTMSPQYTESVWWAFKQLWDQKRIYQGRKVVPYCYRCETPLSNAETRVDDATRPRKDTTITAKFPAKYHKGGRGIGLLILNDKNEVLLIHRNEPHREIIWAMPGGKVDGDETFEQAAHREAEEELGVKIESLEPFISQPQIFEGRLFHTVCFATKIIGTPKVCVPDEIDELKWWPFNKLPEPLYIPSRDALETYKSGVKKILVDIDVKKDKPKVNLLAWTTTPWTLISNQLLAISPNEKYSLVKYENEFYILASELVAKNFQGKGKDEYEIISQFPAKDLSGLKYEPLFDLDATKNYEKSFRVLSADFVGSAEGTGIVHLAEFGEDDFVVFQKEGIDPLDPIDEHGIFKSGFLQGKGIHEVEDLVLNYLYERNFLFKKEKQEHNYPHCWRCDTPLMYRPLSAWYIRVEDMHDRMLALNEKIHWVPDSIKHNRFGKWLEGSRDWLISRNRYWGAPMPVWKCDNSPCDNVFVPESFMDLEAKMPARNRWFALRHGESEKNVPIDIDASDIKLDKYHLTENGIKQAKKVAMELKSLGITKIFSGDFLRAKETAIIVADLLGLKVEIDIRLREAHFYKLEGIPSKSPECLKILAPWKADLNYRINPKSETQNEVRRRVKEFFREVDRKYQGENILIVTHGSPIRCLLGATYDLSWKELSNLKVEPGEFITVSPKIIHTMDSHRPEIDKHTWTCEKCKKGGMKRIEEVLDCWVESAAMPFAQYNYPFRNKQKFLDGHPSDFIVEYAGQVRTWFYYMHVMSSALFNKPAFKNVIVHGIVFGSDGRKMSKRLKNYPDIEKSLLEYGADAMRFSLAASPILHGDDASIKEEMFAEARNRVLRPFWNTYSFFSTYVPKEFKPEISSKLLPKNKLDKWILSALSQLITDVETALDSYELQNAARPIVEFLDVLTNWYIRRSRERFSHDKNLESFQVLYSVLVDFCKVLAPFMPFLTDKIYRELTEKESVHLEDWPKIGKIDKKLNQEIEPLRQIANLGLRIRAQENIQVRQPLKAAFIHISHENVLDRDDTTALLEELNVGALGMIDNVGVEKKMNVFTKGQYVTIAEMIISPDARILGPRLGKKVQEIIQKAKSGDFEFINRTTVKVGDEELGEGEYEIQWRAKEGFAVAAEKGIVLALDTVITPELKASGIARSFIRVVQDQRKKIGMTMGEVANKIVITDGSQEIIDALKKKEVFIKHKTNVSKIIYRLGGPLEKGIEASNEQDESIYGLEWQLVE